MFNFAMTAVVVASASAMPWIATSGPYAKAPALGIHIGSIAHGRYDAITDVAGVRVGPVTHISGNGRLVPGVGPVRTGVTAILPRPDVWHKKVFAAAWALNGNGEMTGTTWLNEVGTLEEPILLCDTMSVGRVYDGVETWMIGKYPGVGITDDEPIPVVMEIADDFLNDHQGRHDTAEDAVAALDAAVGGPVAQGVVGAGTGAVSFEFKGGIGTASRVLAKQDGGYTVGVLLNANNTGGRESLVVDGVPVGKLIPSNQLPLKEVSLGRSIDVVVATNAPLSHDQLRELGKRAFLGLARGGWTSHFSSGDLVIAFSTANVVPHYPEARTFGVTALSEYHINPLFYATEDAAQEALLNQLLAAQTVVGQNGNTAHALPHDLLLKLLHKYHRI